MEDGEATFPVSDALIDVLSYHNSEGMWSVFEFLKNVYM